MVACVYVLVSCVCTHGMPTLCVAPLAVCRVFPNDAYVKPTNPQKLGGHRLGHVEENTPYVWRETRQADRQGSCSPPTRYCDRSLFLRSKYATPLAWDVRLVVYA